MTRLEQIELVLDYLKHQAKRPNHCNVADWINDYMVIHKDELHIFTNALLSFGSDNIDTKNRGASVIANIINEKLLEAYFDDAKEWREQAQIEWRGLTYEY